MCFVLDSYDPLVNPYMCFVLDSYDPLVNPYVFCFGLLRPFSQPLCVLFWTLTTL